MLVSLCSKRDVEAELIPLKEEFQEVDYGASKRAGFCCCCCCKCLKHCNLDLTIASERKYCDR
jgi:hypothetical protein